MMVWIAFALVSVIVVLVLAVPLIRGRGTLFAGRKEYDLTVYKDQLAEVERDRARGVLSEEQTEASRIELKRRLLNAADKPETAAEDALDETARNRARKATLIMAVMVAVFIPAGGAFLYNHLGSPALPAQPFAQRDLPQQTHMAASGEMSAEDIANMVKRLEDRLAETPNDPQGWAMLGRSYMTMERFSDAATAFGKAIEHGLVDVELFADMGEAIAFASNGNITDAANTAFLNALRVDPRDPRSRYYAGLYYMQKGDGEKAIAAWRDLSRDSPEDAPWMPMLKQRMSEVAMDAGIMPINVEPRHPLQLVGEQPVLPSQRDEGAGASSEGVPQAAIEADKNRPEGGGFSADEKEMIMGMIAGLEDKMAENPDDLAGWERLARSYDVLGQPEKAVTAWRNIARLLPEDIDAQLSYAMVLLEAGRAKGEPEPTPEVYDIMRMVHEKAPDNPNALYFLGLEAAEKGNADAAREYWQSLMENLPANNPIAQDIQQRLDAL